ncbi:hypothetical protein RA264_28535, partial [Pseudomonas syringae pv. tagetis]|uniref:hypothetical protein n=1 Tax=Pseudomonas syringae group genomosp. 7 TaxID=251699 RepID=UPI00376FFF57
MTSTHGAANYYQHHVEYEAKTSISVAAADSSVDNTNDHQNRAYSADHPANISQHQYQASDEHGRSIHDADPAFYSKVTQTVV